MYPPPHWCLRLGDSIKSFISNMCLGHIINMWGSENSSPGEGMHKHLGYSIFSNNTTLTSGTNSGRNKSPSLASSPKYRQGKGGGGNKKKLTAESNCFLWPTQFFEKYSCCHFYIILIFQCWKIVDKRPAALEMEALGVSDSFHCGFHICYCQTTYECSSSLSLCNNIW